MGKGISNMAESAGTGEHLSRTLLAGSDFIFDYICKLCEEEDRHVEAVGYCVDCSDYLCATCYKNHCKPKPLRHHVLLDQQHMPKTTDAANVTRKPTGKTLADMMWRFFSFRQTRSQNRDQAIATDFQHLSIKPTGDQAIATDFQHLSIKPTGTGPFSKDPKDIAVNHVTDINVKLDRDSDKEECWIRGSVVLPGQKLVICDSENNNIKVIDMKTQTVVSVIQLDYHPSDIAQVKNAELVTTIPFVGLQFLSLTPDNKLSLGKKVRLQGTYCRGIACTKDKIIVSFDISAMVQVMDMNGVVMKTITADHTGKQLFKLPWYVAVSPSQDIIYVSDRGMHTVTCLTMDGQVIAVYREGELGFPSKPGVDSNCTVYIGWHSSNHVYLLSSKLEKTKELTIPGMISPNCLSVCEESGSIVIGQDTDNIKIVQLS